jgi:hypothetical protein
MQPVIPWNRLRISNWRRYAIRHIQLDLALRRLSPLLAPNRRTTSTSLQIGWGGKGGGTWLACWATGSVPCPQGIYALVEHWRRLAECGGGYTEDCHRDVSTVAIIPLCIIFPDFIWMTLVLSSPLQAGKVRDSSNKACSAPTIFMLMSCILIN